MFKKPLNTDKMWSVVCTALTEKTKQNKQKKKQENPLSSSTVTCSVPTALWLTSQGSERQPHTETWTLAEDPELNGPGCPDSTVLCYVKSDTSVNFSVVISL